MSPLPYLSLHNGGVDKVGSVVVSRETLTFEGTGDIICVRVVAQTMPAAGAAHQAGGRCRTPSRPKERKLSGFRRDTVWIIKV